MKTHVNVSKKLALATMVAAISGGYSYSALAQDSDDEIFAALEEVVVTAQRREQNLQDVPFAVSAFGTDAIEKGDMDDFQSIEAQIPGMVIAGDERMNITMRGIGVDSVSTTSAEASVPVNIDGVYMTRATIGESVYGDLQSIEVLKGPQGTLYGRNASGGTINFFTKTPGDEFEGGISLLAGNYDRIRARGVLSGPITDTFGARLTLASDQRDGFRENISNNTDVDDRDHTSAALTLSFTPTEEMDIIFRASTADNDNGGPVTQFAEGLAPFTGDGTTLNPASFGASLTPPLTAEQVGPSDPLEVAHNKVTSVETTSDIASLTFSYDLGPVVFKSVSAYQEHTSARDDDNEGSGIDWTDGLLTDENEAWTQEFTIASNADGAIDWVAGVWYMEDEGFGTADFIVNPASSFPFTTIAITLAQDTTSYAAFGQATWRITDQLRVTGGLRYSVDEKDARQSQAIGPINGCGPGVDFADTSDDWSVVTPKLAIDFDVSDNVMLYTSASTGYKSGGVNFGTCRGTYDEENVTSYEAGFKSDLLDNRLRLNVNAFYFDYEDLQVTTISDGVVLIDNAATAENYGLELDLTARVNENFTVSSAITWQNAEFQDFLTATQLTRQPIRLDGNQLPNAPDLSWSINADYAINISDTDSLTFRLEHSWTDSRYLSQFNEEYQEQDAVGITNARAIYEIEGGSLAGAEVHVFINNIEDEHVLRRVGESTVTGGYFEIFGEPQTYGVELKYSF